MIAATVIGNLGRDGELRQTSGGSVLSLNVASSDKQKDGEVTTWIRASMFGKRAEAVASYCTKGKTVAVSGTMFMREYEDKSGAKQKSLEMRVNELKLLGGGERNAGASNSRQQERAPSGGGSYPDEDYGSKSGKGDDDIPFLFCVTAEPTERWWRF